MRSLTATLKLSMAIVFATVALAALCAPAAQAQTYRDVPKGFWDRAAINWVTNQGPAGAKLLDDYAGAAFKPNQPITREQLAAALVTAMGQQRVTVASPVALADLPATDAYFHAVQVALALRFFTVARGKFDPEAGVTESQADHALVRMIYLLHPHNDWDMLRALAPDTWQPAPGWETGAPSRLPWEVAARLLGLRYNHLSAPALEVSPGQDIDRAEAAYMFKAALTVAPWRIQELSWFDQVSLPTLSARQKQIIAFALQYVGYPYVWGGTYPTPDSPYGPQAHGGFDCSGFVWWVLKMNFGYAIPNAQRTAAQMAAAAKPRIPMAKLAPCDIIFFGPKGAKSSAASVFHTGIYLGNGWFIESSNLFDGVTLANLRWPGWYYASEFAWGRQVLLPAQLGAVTGG
jgi:cell wall-associated NlpC family hydrolase